MQCLEVSGAVRHIYGSLGIKQLKAWVLPTQCFYIVFYKICKSYGIPHQELNFYCIALLWLCLLMDSIVNFVA